MPFTAAIMKSRTTVSALLVAAPLQACASESSFPTVPGPEDARVLRDASGYVAIAATGSRPASLFAIAGHTTRTLPRDPSPGSFPSAIVPDGPRAALILDVIPGWNDAKTATVALSRVAACDDNGGWCERRATPIASWTVANPLHAYHLPLARSPDGRFAAVVPATHVLKGPAYSPRIASDTRFPGIRYVGELHVVDIEGRRTRATGIDVVDEQPMTWSADGRRLWIVRAERREHLPPSLAAGIDRPTGHEGQGVPVIETWDVETGATTMIAIGQRPLPSPDGRTLLHETASRTFVVRDLASGVERPARLTGLADRGDPIAFVGPRAVLYGAVPTEGESLEFTTMNSPLVGPKALLSLKVVDLDTGRFAKIATKMDPRANTGYAAVR